MSSTVLSPAAVGLIVFPPSQDSEYALGLFKKKKIIKRNNTFVWDIKSAMRTLPPKSLACDKDWDFSGDFWLASWASVS